MSGIENTTNNNNINPLYHSTTARPSSSSSSIGGVAPATTAAASYMRSSSYNNNNSSGGGGGGSGGISASGRGGPSIISSAAHQLLSAAQRAQHEVDVVNGAANELAMHQEAAERVERQHQALTERVDASSLQVASLNDKIANLGQMFSGFKVQLSENERKLRDENSELRSKIKRLEKQVEQEREDRGKQSEGSIKIVRENMERFYDEHLRILKAEIERSNEKNEAAMKLLARDNERLRHDVDQLRNETDRFDSLRLEVQSFCNKFADQERQNTKENLDNRLQEFRIRFEELSVKINDARTKVEDATDKIDQASQSQHELRRTMEEIRRRADPIKDWCEDKIAHLRNELRDFTNQRAEKLSADLGLQIAEAHNNIADNEASISDARQQIVALVHSSEESVKKCNSSLARSEENIQDLRQMSDQNRELLVQQLEATKEWASRNIMRLKKHLDLAVSDMAATRQAQLEIQTNFHKLTQAHLDEKNALVEQLNRKKKEASLLTQQVDREVSEVTNMIHSWEESRRNAQMKRQAKDELRALSHMP